MNTDSKPQIIESQINADNKIRTIIDPVRRAEIR